jgi:hypothetical protein
LGVKIRASARTSGLSRAPVAWIRPAASSSRKAAEDGSVKIFGAPAAKMPVPLSFPAP